MNSSTVEIRNANWRLCIRPALGGSVEGLWLGETPVLRPAPSDPVHAGQTAAYPLVPYSNRIGEGRMDWGGERYLLKNGFNDEAHALHGVGCLRAWSVESLSVGTVHLRLVHEPDAFWPFAFEAEQQFVLLEDGLRLTLSACNTDSRTQPMGIGWHPYFLRRPQATLDLPVHTQWLAHTDLLPRAPQPVNGLHGSVADMALDQCFVGSDGVAQMSDLDLDLTLQADSRYWVVYTPQDAAFYCVEPVTHLNNAVQQDDPLQHGLVALEPGQWFRQTVSLRGRRKR